MTRKILGTLVALSLPVMASAKPNDLPLHQMQPVTSQPLPTTPGRVGIRGGNLTQLNGSNGSNGAGNDSKSNGDVTGPGQGARIDTSTKGPLNDVQPGNPQSEDVLRSANPHPVR